MALLIFIGVFLAVICWITYGGEEWVKDRALRGAWIWTALALIIAIILFLAPFVPQAVREVNNEKISQHTDYGP